MDFSRPAEVEALIGRLSAFVEREVMPLEGALRAEGFVACHERLEAARRKAREEGLWAPHLPRELGGLGLPLTAFAHVSEALGRSPAGHYVVNAQAPDVGNMELLMAHGSEAQKARWLGPLARGEIRSCFSMTEPEHAGSNPTELSTTAVLDGGEWVINGHKWFTSSADGAAFAIVMAVTEQGASAHGRASMILVPTDTRGFRRVRNIPVMGEAGDGWASHAEIVYEDVRVPEENLIGRRGMGFMLAQERLGPGRIHHCMRWIGICERAFSMMCQRAATRELGPGKALGTRQTVQSWIAESRASIDAARLMVLEAAWRIEEQGAYAARESISTIKFFVAGVMQEVLDRAIQVHGALGMTDDTVLAWLWRHERAARIYDGPDEVHKMVVARRILRGYGLEGR